MVPGMKETHPKKYPSLVYANEGGEIIDLPDLAMAGRSGRSFRLPELSELIPLPEGSELFMLPDRVPVGIDPLSGHPVALKCDPGGSGRIAAVAAFMAPAYTSLYTAAFQKEGRDARVLPLFAYSAVGWLNGRFWVAAFRADPDERQDAGNFDVRIIRSRTRRMLKRYSENRLVRHLGHCCLTYGCPAARNYFMGRWEAPLPTSPACNASCVGCISLQPSGCCPSTQDRISFVPTPEEIAGVALPHIRRAERPVVSFGQGCEGEPLMQAATIEKAIRLIRRATSRGTINLNSNASMPDRIERLACAGLDSVRVSLSSAQKRHYTLYYRPMGYAFDDVLESIRVMKRKGRFVSLNYFILPGVTDDPAEAAAFHDLVEDCRPDFIQLRNLNMDPDWYLSVIRYRRRSEPAGIGRWLADLKCAFPWLRFGYFNPYLGKDA